MRPARPSRRSSTANPSGDRFDWFCATGHKARGELAWQGSFKLLEICMVLLGFDLCRQIWQEGDQETESNRQAVRRSSSVASLVASGGQKPGIRQGAEGVRARGAKDLQKGIALDPGIEPGSPA
jgi:hypothetical protein